MTSMLVAVDYDILRGLSPSGRIAIPLVRKPVRVATMLREDAFLASGALMKHHVTVILEDESHDWRWDNGHFWYYTRVADKADALVAYQTVRVGPFSPEEWVIAFTAEHKLHHARRNMATRLVQDVYDRQMAELSSLPEERRVVVSAVDSMSRHLNDNSDSLSAPWQFDLAAWLASHKGFATVLSQHARTLARGAKTQG
jgi:hypothetical protein